MSDRIELRDISTLADLKTALGRFSETVEEVLQAIEAQLQQERQRLRNNVARTALHAEQAEKTLVQAEVVLRACMASGKNSRSCSAESRAVARARERLVQAQQSLRTARRWQQTIEKEIDRYRQSARDFQTLAGDHTDQARARVSRFMQRYQEAKDAAHTVGPTPVARMGAASSTSTPVTWAEQRAILKCIDEGKQISAEEFGKLQQSASDLRYETLALEDQAWIASVIRGDEFYRLTRRLWSGEGPSSDVLAQPLLGGLLSVLKELLGTSLDIHEVAEFWRRSD